MTANIWRLGKCEIDLTRIPVVQVGFFRVWRLESRQNVCRNESFWCRLWNHLVVHRQRRRRRQPQLCHLKVMTNRSRSSSSSWAPVGGLRQPPPPPTTTTTTTQSSRSSDQLGWQINRQHWALYGAVCLLDSCYQINLVIQSICGRGARPTNKSNLM